MSFFNPRLFRVFNNHKEIDVELLDNLKQYETLHKLDEIITTN